MNEIIEKTRELGELIQNSEEMKNVLEQFCNNAGLSVMIGV